MDLFILKTDVEKFTSTNKKTLHLIFKCKITEQPIGKLQYKHYDRDILDRQHPSDLNIKLPKRHI